MSTESISEIQRLLDSPDRQWHGQPGATEEQIDALRHAAKMPLPPQYLDLLRVSNGGEGELALAPLWLQLYEAAEVVRMAADPFCQQEFPGLLFFASNGGLESIAFDRRSHQPWPILMVDCIAGLGSALIIAEEFSEFIQAIGLPGE